MKPLNWTSLEGVAFFGVGRAGLAQRQTHPQFYFPFVSPEHNRSKPAPPNPARR